MEENFLQAEIAKKTQQTVTTEKQLAARLKGQFTPTILFLDERGNIAAF